MNTVRMRTVLLAVLAAGLGGLAGPAQAQISSPLPLRVKLGVFLPEDGGTSLNGEVDLTVPAPGAGRTVVTAGYAEGSEGGRRLRVIPVTISQVFSPPNPASGLTGNVYFGAGAGAYFLRVSGGGRSESKTTLGGFGVAGYQFPGEFFVEAKYHIAGKVAGLSPNGFAFLLGRRF